MRTNIVFTLTGTDRVGIVEEVTGVLLGAGGNVETSRMARLGGEFAMLVLISLPADKHVDLDAAVATLTARGYRVSTVQTAQTYAEAHDGWRQYQIEVQGADHEGIIHDIAAGLSARGISIESMETGVTSASVSGISLFHMSAVVVVPPQLPADDWITALGDAAQQANVDVTVSPA
jgi:glycine cleavage system transcriptional repressor